MSDGILPITRVIRDYPVAWGLLSSPIAIAAGAAFVDVVYTRLVNGELPTASMLAAGGMAALLAVVRLSQIWFKAKDPAMVPIARVV